MTKHLSFWRPSDHRQYQQPLPEFPLPAHLGRPDQTDRAQSGRRAAIAWTLAHRPRDRDQQRSERSACRVWFRARLDRRICPLRRSRQSQRPPASSRIRPATGGVLNQPHRLSPAGPRPPLLNTMAGGAHADDTGFRRFRLTLCSLFVL